MAFPSDSAKAPEVPFMGNCFVLLGFYEDVPLGASTSGECLFTLLDLTQMSQSWDLPALGSYSNLKISCCLIKNVLLHTVKWFWSHIFRSVFNIEVFFLTKTTVWSTLAQLSRTYQVHIHGSCFWDTAFKKNLHRHNQWNFMAFMKYSFEWHSGFFPSFYLSGLCSGTSYSIALRFWL